MTVKEIVIDWLTSHGYDGLCYPGECGCTVDDLAPCELLGPECVAGHSGPIPEGSEWEGAAHDGACFIYPGPAEG